MKKSIIGRKAVKVLMISPLDSFFAANGDQTLRLNYPLNEDSLVFDLGGYQGAWSASIFNKYHCWIRIFEPVSIFTDVIAEHFQNNHKVILHRFGLANDNYQCSMSVMGDASSVYSQGGQTTDIRLVKASDFFFDNNIHHIDLLKINIEGSEYDLLDHLIEINFIERIQDIQVQFHNVIPNAEKRMKKIQKALQRTHHPTYQYHFVWENWSRK